MPRVRKDKKKLKKIKRTRKQGIEKIERKEQEKQNNITVSVNSSGSGGSGGSSSNQHMPSSFQPHIADIKNSLLEVLKGYVMKNEYKQPTNMGSDEHDMMEMKNLDRFIQDEPTVIFKNSPSPFVPNIPIPSLEDLAKNNYMPINAEQPEDYEREFREEEEEKPKRGRKRIIRSPEEEAQHKQDKKENSRLKRERKKEEKLKRERDDINNL